MNRRKDLSQKKKGGGAQPKSPGLIESLFTTAGLIPHVFPTVPLRPLPPQPPLPLTSPLLPGWHDTATAVAVATAIFFAIATTNNGKRKTRTLFKMFKWLFYHFCKCKNKKSYKVMKAIEKSFKMSPIPLC